MSLPDLTGKVGPLPLWAWGGAVGAGLFIAYRRHASSPAGGAAATTSVGGTADTVGNIATPSPTDSSVGGITDNSGWVNAATRALSVQGYDAYAAQQALEAYAEGMPLTTAQQAMVSTAILTVGPPPQAVLTPPPGNGTGGDTSPVEVHQPAPPTVTVDAASVFTDTAPAPAAAPVAAPVAAAAKPAPAQTAPRDAGVRVSAGAGVEGGAVRTINGVPIKKTPPPPPPRRGLR